MKHPSATRRLGQRIKDGKDVIAGVVYLWAWSTPLSWGVRTWRCFQLREDSPLILMNHS